jgi:cell division septum initiation protein DivIVA
MGSSREQIAAALDAVEASYRHLASLPLEVLSRAEKRELLKRLEELEKKMTAFDRRLTGRLIVEARSA